MIKLAEYLGTTSLTLSAKINKKPEKITLGEVKKICERLKIGEKEERKIFFVD